MSRPKLSALRTPLAALGVMVLASMLGDGVVSAALVLPIALTLPGWALAFAVFGGQPEREPATRLGLSVMLSVAAYPLLGLLLYALSVRLTTASVLVAVTLLSAAALAVGAWRSPLDGLARWRSVRPQRAGPVLIVGATGLALVSAPIVAANLLPHPRPARFSVLTLDREWARVPGVVKAQPGQILPIDLAVRNATGRHQRYVITQEIDDGRWSPVRRVELVSGGQWSGQVRVRAPRGRCPHRLQFRLAGAGSEAAPSVNVWVLTGADACPGALAR